jgi:DNA-binding GntR family transcriptional regulator
MVKKALNLLIEAELVEKARQQGIVISRFLENKLSEYFSFIDAVSTSNTKAECGRRDLNPSFKLGKLK